MLVSFCWATHLGVKIGYTWTLYGMGLSPDVAGEHEAEGPFKDHVARTARAMGVRKQISVIEKAPQPDIIRKITQIFYLPEKISQIVSWLSCMPHDKIAALSSFYFPSFGNTFLSLKTGVYYEPFAALFQGDQDVELSKLFFLTRKVAELKTNHELLGPLIGIIVNIACAILLTPAFPIGSYIVGFFAGGCGQQLFTMWNNRRITEMALRHSSPEVQAVAKRLFKEMNNPRPVIFNLWKRIPQLFL